jgi:hypothetical protein
MPGSRWGKNQRRPALEIRKKLRRREVQADGCRNSNVAVGFVIRAWGIYI